jgi:hypothetical protein
MGDMRNGYKMVSLENLRTRDHLGDLNVDRNIILKRILRRK